MKIKTLIVAFVFSLNVSSLLYGHSPKSIEIAYFQEKNLVKLTVNHSVKDKSQHFVDEINISVNEEPMIEQYYILQNDDKAQKAVYMIPGIDLEDKLQIEAKCNKYGSEKEEFSIMDLYKESLELKKSEKESEINKEKMETEKQNKEIKEQIK